MYSIYEFRYEYFYICSGVYVDREVLVFDEEGGGLMKSDRKIGYIGFFFLNNVR